MGKVFLKVISAVWVSARFDGAKNKLMSVGV